MKIFDSIPWIMIIVLCASLGLAPFTPEPHVLEKLKMLQMGALSKPADIFDLVFHGLPWLLLILKSIRSL